MTKTLKYAGIMILVLALFTCAYAQESKRVASISDMSGTVEVRTMQDKKWVPGQIGMKLSEGDILRTKANSWAVLNVDGMAQTATCEVKENSQIKLAQLLENKKDSTQKTLLDLALGEVLIKAKKLHSEKSKFEVKTPTSIVAVRGTTFSVAVKAVE